MRAHMRVRERARVRLDIVPTLLRMRFLMRVDVIVIVGGGKCVTSEVGGFSLAFYGRASRAYGAVCNCDGRFAASPESTHLANYFSHSPVSRRRFTCVLP